MNTIRPANSLDLQYHGLEPDSYTANRLKHATPEHLHDTTRRCFIGPIPEGWLKSHRKSWYKEKLGLGDYSSRRATFTASTGISHSRQLTGLDGPSAGAIFGQNLPQPGDLDEDEIGGISQEQSDVEDTTEIAPINTADAAEEGLRQADGASAKPISDVQSRIDSQNLLKPPNGRTPTEESVGKSRDKQSFVTAPGHGISPPDKGASSISKAAQDNESAGPSHGEQAPGTNGNRKIEEPLEAGSPTRSSAFNRDVSPSPRTDTNSLASLIPHQRKPELKSIASKSTNAPLNRHPPRAISDEGIEPHQQQTKRGLTFDISDNIHDRQDRLQARIKRVQDRTYSNRFRKNKLRDGEVVKMEKMLVRVESTRQTLPSDYNENSSQKTDSRVVDKWKEFVVVCRQSEDEDGDFTLQMYQTRVIREIESTKGKKRSKYDISLHKKTTGVNLYSSLDKTVVIWHPYRKKTMIYIMRPRSAAHSVEWYTFLRDVLGWKRPRQLQIHVPDLSVTLRIDKPFEHLEASRAAIQHPDGDDAALMRTMVEEQAVAQRLIRESVKMLEDSPEWANILDLWTKTEKMGLAWKRYDRLEWIYGANEQKMYGTMAMLKSHDLELRPKQHYPTMVETRDGKWIKEPPPVEGFLIRLTSQKGVHSRMGKMFFKRLYYSTHNQYLCFCRPAKASPPAPPRLPSKRGSNIPSASEIVEQTPLIFSVNPFSVENGEITWLTSGNAVHIRKHDQEAFDENQRNAQMVSDSDGYVNLCKVVNVRNVVWGALSADPNVDEGPNVEFHQEVPDTTRQDGTTDNLDDDRTFELVLTNGLVIRLQAYNEETKREWMSRLTELVDYWKRRVAADMDLFKMIRRINFDRLNIDEEIEASFGQYADKWEVARAAASPQLYHMCGISCCRSISISGVLYRKRRRHSTFVRCGVILCAGKLHIFQGSLRKRTGEEIPHTHSERVTTLDLADCYLYSGLLTDNDLLYQNQTFDSNHPGHHALPRVYLEDRWTSSDEDTMTCFVVWHSLRRNWFRSVDEEKKEEEGDGGGKRQRLKHLSKLGVPGRSIVFKTRSRAERDHWVMSIGMEIERLQQGEDIRVVSSNNSNNNST